jgi:hypothetical protein
MNEGFVPTNQSSSDGVSPGSRNSEGASGECWSGGGVGLGLGDALGIVWDVEMAEMHNVCICSQREEEEETMTHGAAFLPVTYTLSRSVGAS